MNGSPGTSCIAQKVAVAINQTVMMPWIRRFTVYQATSYDPLSTMRAKA